MKPILMAGMPIWVWSISEGEDFTTRLVDQAFGKLQAARYRGKITKFTFENFVNIHLKAHKMLVEAKYGTNGLGLMIQWRNSILNKELLKRLD